MRTVHVVVPSTIDDPALPSGGNAYDRRVCDGLTAMGWSVRLHPTPGRWPRPDSTARASLRRVLAAVPDGQVALLDGLIACCSPDVVVPEAGRLRVVVLVHMPLAAPGDDGAGPVGAAEREVLSAAAAVVTTSAWTRRWLLQRYALDPGRVAVAQPGAEPAPLAARSADGGELLCVAAVTPGKGHDELLAALARVADLAWRCTCVGALTLDPAFVDGLVRQARESGIADRVHFTGALGGPELDRRYAASDLLLLPSRFETYGMVVTEALARGIPAVVTSVGGLPEALGHDAGGARPGVVVGGGDPEALAGALRSWLVEDGLRDRLRAAAAGRRVTLAPWSTTARRVADALVSDSVISDSRAR